MVVFRSSTILGDIALVRRRNVLRPTEKVALRAWLEDKRATGELDLPEDDDAFERTLEAVLRGDLVIVRLREEMPRLQDVDPVRREPRSVRPPERPRPTWIEVEVVDHSGAKLPGLELEVELPDGEVRWQRLDSSSKWRADDIEARGSCRVRVASIPDPESWVREGALVPHAGDLLTSRSADARASVRTGQHTRIVLEPARLDLRLVVRGPRGESISVATPLELIARFGDGTEEPFEALEGPLYRLAIDRPHAEIGIVVRSGGGRALVVDPQAPGEGHVVSVDDADAIARAGGCYFTLPSEWNTADFRHRAEHGSFRGGAFIGLSPTRIPIEPVDLALDPVWQHVVFEYFDRGERVARTVPRLGRGMALALEGHVSASALRARMEETPPPREDAEVVAVWDHSQGGRTIHCLPWLRRRLSSGAAVRDLPDAETALCFSLPDHTFLDHRGGRTEIRVVPPDHELAALVHEPCAERMWFYDLPAQWCSLDYPARLAGEAPMEKRAMQELATRVTSISDPIVVSLDDVVLTKATQTGPSPFEPSWSRPDTVLTIYDERVETPYRPSTRYGGSTNRELLAPHPSAQGVLTDLPPGTRLVLLDHTAYSVFEGRTTRRNHQQRMAATGLRLGIELEKDRENTTFGRLREGLTARYPEREDSLGLMSVVTLRCCGHEAERERVVALVWGRLVFEYLVTAREHEASEVTALEEVPEPKEARKLEDDVLDWVARELINAPAPQIELADGRGPSIVSRALLQSKNWVHPFQHLRVRIYEECRAHVDGDESRWSMEDLRAPTSKGTPRTAVHEVAHAFGCPDEYVEQHRFVSWMMNGLPDRVPGSPYQYDVSSLMMGNGAPRPRHYWHFAEAVALELGLSTRGRISVRVGEHHGSFTDEIAEGSDNAPYVPVRMAIGARPSRGGAFDAFLYRLHHEPPGLGGFRGSTDEHFDGVLVLKVNIAWTVEAPTMAFLARVMNQVRANNSLGWELQTIATGNDEGGVRRVAVLVSIRHLLRTFPPETDRPRWQKVRDGYLKKTNLHTREAYEERVAWVSEKAAPHVEARIVRGPAHFDLRAEAPIRADIRTLNGEGMRAHLRAIVRTALGMPSHFRFDPDSLGPAVRTVYSPDDLKLEKAPWW